VGICPAAVNTTVPATPAALAVTVCAPGSASRVQPPSVAKPPPSVLCTAPLRLPLVAPAAKVTVTPATGLPPASVTRTDGNGPASGSPAMPVNVTAPFAAIASAAPGRTCRVPVADPAWFGSVTTALTAQVPTSVGGVALPA